METSMGRRIRELRKSFNLNQTEFSEKIGCTKNTVGNWETDSVLPDLKAILAIKDIFNVNLNWLLFGKGEMNSENPNFEDIARMIAPNLPDWEIKRIERFLRGIQLRVVRNEFDITLSNLPGKLEMMKADQKEIEKIKAIQ